MLRLATKFRPSLSAFETAAAAGFRNAEFYLDASVLDDVDGVIDLAQRFNFGFALHFPNKPELSERHLYAVARLHDELAATATVIHPNMLRRYGDRMKAIHPTISLAEETMRVPADDFLHWVDQHDSVTLDVEHIWKFSLHDGPLADLFALVRTVFSHHGDKVKHIHMPGYLPGQGEHRPMYTSREFCLGIFDILADFNYPNLVVSEVDMCFQNRLDLKMDVLLFERWMETRNENS